LQFSSYISILGDIHDSGQVSLEHRGTPPFILDRPISTGAGGCQAAGVTTNSEPLTPTRPTFTLILLIKIVLCSKFPRTKFTNVFRHEISTRSRVRARVRVEGVRALGIRTTTTDLQKCAAVPRRVRI
jgi:hypothetical protein